MDRSAPTFVSGVERRQQVTHLRAPDLADDDAVRSHAEGLADQGLEIDLADPLDVRRASLEADDVRMVGSELARVLDEHQPLPPDRRG